MTKRERTARRLVARARRHAERHLGVRRVGDTNSFEPGQKPIDLWQAKLLLEVAALLRGAKPREGHEPEEIPFG